MASYMPLRGLKPCWVVIMAPEPRLTKYPSFLALEVTKLAFLLVSFKPTRPCPDGFAKAMRPARLRASNRRLLKRLTGLWCERMDPQPIGNRWLSIKPTKDDQPFARGAEEQPRAEPSLS